MKLKVMVTGGSGLVGSALKKISKKYDYDYIFLSSKDGDLCELEQTKLLFEKHKPDYVIHLAACVGGLFKNMNEKVKMFEDNVLINFNVIKCSHDYKVKKLISCLSTCIFPDKTTYPINETMLHNGPPHSSNDAYAYAKRMLEIHSKTYQDRYNDNFICVIPTNIYGPHDNFNLKDAHVIPALIHKCFLAKKENKPFIVYGSGKPLRQFIYSEDLANLFMWTLENYNRKDSLILSVSEEEEVSIKKVASEIAKAFDYSSMMTFDTTFSDGQFKKTADNSKLLNLIGEYNFISIEKGIKSSVDWFINNYEICRK